MQLRKKFLETGANAATNYVQVGHRRTAIEYALAGIKRHHDAVLEAFGHDPFSLEMEGTMRAWVAETLLQGAYLREYHLWEKDCKAYFPEMAQRNGDTLVMKKSRASLSRLLYGICSRDFLWLCLRTSPARLKPCMTA